MNTTKTKLIIICLLAIMNVSQAQVSIWQGKSSQITDFLDNLESKGFSGQVLMAGKAGIWINKGYGYANREKKIKIDGTSVFDIGSITKSYTRVAIYSLIEQKKLHLTSELSDIFPDVPADKKGITIQQILDMKAGIVDYVPKTRGDFHEITQAETRDRILKAKLLFEPGTSQRYSNSGYILLAMVIEERSGLSYEDFLSQFIFPKSVADHGFYGGGGWKEARVVYGYDNLKHGDNNTPYHWKTTSWVLRGSGGIITSAKGLYEWRKALKDGQVLGQKGTDLFKKSRRGSENENKRMSLLAGGGGYGFTSILAEVPDGSLSVIINSNTANFEAEDVFMDILDLVKGKQPRSEEDAELEEGSPEQKRLMELLQALKEGDLNTFMKSSFTQESIENLGEEDLLGFLASVREKYGSFKLIKPLRLGRRELKFLVESTKTGDKRVLIMELIQQAPFKIDAIGLAPYNKVETSGVNDSKEMSKAEKQLRALLTALSKKEKELKYFIQNQFAPQFLEAYGVDGHYDFLMQFKKGFEILEVLETTNKKVVVRARNKENQEPLKIIMNITKDHKIEGIMFED